MQTAVIVVQQHMDDEQRKVFQACPHVNALFGRLRDCDGGVFDPADFVADAYILAGVAPAAPPKKWGLACLKLESLLAHAVQSGLELSRLFPGESGYTAAVLHARLCGVTFLVL